MSKKKFEELDLMDNFLVLALASDLEGGPAYGRLLAEGLLHEKVAHVRVHAEKIIPGSDEIGRGIRMDVEMQSFSHKPEERYRYMTWGEYIDFETMEAKAEARKEGHAEGKEQGLAEGRAEATLVTRREDILDALNELGTVSDDIVEKINAVTDIDMLKSWFKIAIKADSIETFVSQTVS